jgi:hypothetical protein
MRSSLVSYRIWKASNQKATSDDNVTQRTFIWRGLGLSLTTETKHGNFAESFNNFQVSCVKQCTQRLWVAGRCANLVTDTGQDSVWEQNNFYWTSLLQRFWDCQFECVNKANTNCSPVNRPTLTHLNILIYLNIILAALIQATHTEIFHTLTYTEVKELNSIFPQSELWMIHRRSCWPRGLRRRSAAVRLLGSRVQIQLRAWMFVSCVCCVLCK